MHDTFLSQWPSIVSGSIEFRHSHHFRSIESVANILRTLHNTTHNGFPVWAHEADEESAYGEVAGQDVSKRLEGIILRSQLLVLLQRRHFVDSQGTPVSSH